MKHAMVLNLLSGRLHLAPIKDNVQIIDLGTGTGIWCMESESSSGDCLSSNN